MDMGIQVSPSGSLIKIPNRIKWGSLWQWILECEKHWYFRRMHRENAKESKEVKQKDTLYCFKQKIMIDLSWGNGCY